MTNTNLAMLNAAPAIAFNNLLLLDNDRDDLTCPPKLLEALYLLQDAAAAARYYFHRFVRLQISSE